MAKTFITIEDSLVDINSIRYIDRFEEWSINSERFVFGIIINDPKRIKVEPIFPVYKFDFYTEKDRDIIYEEITDRLTDNGIVII